MAHAYSLSDTGRPYLKLKHNKKFMQVKCLQHAGTSKSPVHLKVLGKGTRKGSFYLGVRLPEG